MKSLQLRSRLAWAAPVLVVFPLLMGADGGGCAPGGPIFVGSGEDAGPLTDGGVMGVDAGSACTPASCVGLAVPALAKVCPDGTTLTESVCEEQPNGKCDWGFPDCPTDACVALPCVPCAFGSVGTGTDVNGCPTCPICAPPPDGGSCPPAPVCNLPDCRYGVIAQKDASGCEFCPVCAPPQDAGSCQCGALPPVAACPGSGSRSITCEPVSTGACSWVVGSCPNPTDGDTGCQSDADCPGGDVCGFLETSACGATGSCFTAPTIICNAYSPGCACDGSEVDVICNGLPTGYARKPLKHTGACADGG